MKSKRFNNKTSKQVVELNEEQQNFKDLCLENMDTLKGRIITHRGVQIRIGGAGEFTFMYYIAIKGLSDKDEVEFTKLFLDWDDSALEDDIVPQVQSILFAIEPAQEPIDFANICGK